MLDMCEAFSFKVGSSGPPLWLVRLGAHSFPVKHGLGTGPLMLPSGAIVEQGEDLRVLVVPEADTIVVTLPGTRYSITYRKLHDSPWLVSSHARDDQDSPINKHKFRARAWVAANEKARKLGWIV
jgi:hypothetical protein